MRKTYSPSRNKVAAQISARYGVEENKLSMNKSTQYLKYFCHFNNAVYMGGMSGFKKNGKGLILHDDGSAVISDYLHDTPNGHNIIFRENSIISMLHFNPNDFQIAYKQGNYVILLPFNEGSIRVNGSGVLLDFHDHKIFKLIYKKGTLVSKILHLDKKDNQDVFGKNTATKIIGVKHQQAFELTFQKPFKLHINSQRNKKTIGYHNDDGQLQGLSFTFYAQNLTTNGEKPLYLKFIQRGYYSNSLMHVFGQKIFTNGNKYVGEFDNGQFDGYGILVSPGEMKWVYGRFMQGHLNKIEESNYKQYSEEEYLNWNQNLRSLHKRFRQRWIDMDINLPEQLYLYKKLKESIELQMTHIEPDHQSVIIEEFNKLSRVQEQFQNSTPASHYNSRVQKQLDNIYQSPTLKPEPIKIETEDSGRKVMGVSRKLDTPINRFKSTAEKQYRAEDPFAFDLFEVPFGPARQTSYPIKQQILQSKAIKVPSPRNAKDRQFLDCLKNYSFPDNQRRQAIREQTSRKQLENEILRRSLSRERGIRSSRIPFRQPSPPREQYQSQKNIIKPYIEQRYVGSITNKRNFNYQIDQKQQPYFKDVVASAYNKYPTATKYFPSEEYVQPDRRSPQSYRNSPTKNHSPQKNDNLYLDGRSQPYVPRKGEERGHFIRNNYQYLS